MSVQPIDSQKPDLEESMNVAQEHASVSRTAGAAAREQQVRENGLEPVSIWIFIVGSIIAIIAGSVLFKSNNLFGYDSFVKSGYTQAEETGGPPPIPQEEIVAFYMSKGKAKYAACASCHNGDGKGNAGFPPLAGSKWVTDSPIIPGLAVINGVNGKINVLGVDYSAAMPAQGGDTMADLELAALIYYIQNSFGNKVGKIYKPEQIQQIRDINSKRSADGPCTAPELEKFKGQQLTGDHYEAGTIINKKTGEVIETE